MPNAFEHEVPYEFRINVVKKIIDKLDANSHYLEGEVIKPDYDVERDLFKEDVYAYDEFVEGFGISEEVNKKMQQFSKEAKADILFINPRVIVDADDFKEILNAAFLNCPPKDFWYNFALLIKTMPISLN